MKPQSLNIDWGKYFYKPEQQQQRLLMLQNHKLVLHGQNIETNHQQYLVLEIRKFHHCILKEINLDICQRLGTFGVQVQNTNRQNDRGSHSCCEIILLLLVRLLLPITVNTNICVNFVFTNTVQMNHRCKCTRQQ